MEYLPIYIIIGIYVLAMYFLMREFLISIDNIVKNTKTLSEQANRSKQWK